MKRSTGLLAFCLLSMVSLQAAALPAEPADTTALEEITVSAIKSSPAIATRAVSGTSVGAAEAERLGIVSLHGISDVVPNFFVPDYGSRITSSIYVRGLGARMDQPVVGFIVDDVPVMNKDGYDFDIADIVGVTMLRGPQSTLYGRNTMGGVINVTTLSPMRWQGWRFSAEYGSADTWKATAGWYHKFSRRAAMAVTANANGSDGFFRNRYNGRKIDRELQGGGRFRFDWRISPEVTLRNTFALSALRQGGYPYEYVPDHTIAYNDTCFYHRFMLSDGLTLSWRHPGFMLSSVTSVQYIDDNMTLDQDFLPMRYFTLTQKKRDLALTQDVVIRGNVPANGYSWLCGLFGFYKHLDMNAPVTFLDYGIEKLIVSNRNESNPDYPIRWDSDSFPLNSDFTIPTWGLAAYHQSQYELGDFIFTAGLRLDYERATLNYHSYCSTGYDVFHLLPSGKKEYYTHTDIDINDRGHLSRDFLELLPKVSVLYNIPSAELFNIYASVAKGYKAGGFNTQMFSDVLQQRLMNIMGVGYTYDIGRVVSYKPEKSWNFEIGSHLEALSGRLKADISFFYIDCRDQQLTMFPDGSTTGRIMTNAGKTRSFGGEVSLSWSPAERISLNASYGYTDARFRDFFDGIVQYRGKHIPYAPCNTFFAQAVWTLPLGSGFFRSITFDANVRGTGRVYWNDTNSLHQPFYALLGGSIGVAGRNWQLQLSGLNLTDTQYSTFYFVSIGNDFLQRGKPARFAATLRIQI